MRIPAVLWFALLAGAARAQIHVPALSLTNRLELNTRSNFPLMRTESRMQFIVSRTELGGAASASLAKLTLRYDGPSVGAGGGSIANLDIFLGNTGVAPNDSSACFDANYSGSLTQVAALTNVTFGADGSPNGPEPWGGPTGEFVFAFSSPFAYTGGNLVIELRTGGNSNGGSGANNCQLDAEEDPLVGPGGGTASPGGTGCGAATLRVSGQLAPGGEVSCHGTSLGASAPVLNVLGTSNTSWGTIPLPFALDGFGAPGCSLQNNWVVIQIGVADPTGTIGEYASSTAWCVPPDPQLASVALYFQFVSIDLSANPLGVKTSNHARVDLGTYTPLFRGYVGHFHHLSRNATIAALSAPVILAMKFD
jgi:hypothetical protein